MTEAPVTVQRPGSEAESGLTLHQSKTDSMTNKKKGQRELRRALREAKRTYGITNNPVAKNSNKFNKPKTHKLDTDYKRRWKLEDDELDNEDS